MSDAPAAEEPKKKKGKLPIIIVALVLAGGGFFMMKGKGGKEKEKPKIELAEKETEMEEFLTNTANPNVYIRTKIALCLKKGFEEAKFTANLGDVRDAILTTLNSTTPQKINNTAYRPELKRRIAEAINTALEGPLEEEGKEEKKEKEPKRVGKVTAHEDPKGEKKDKEKSMDDWDSKTGPVLKVRFMTLATQ